MNFIPSSSKVQPVKLIEAWHCCEERLKPKSGKWSNEGPKIALTSFQLTHQVNSFSAQRERERGTMRSISYVAGREYIIEWVLWEVETFRQFEMLKYTENSLINSHVSAPTNYDPQFLCFINFPHSTRQNAKQCSIIINSTYQLMLLDSLNYGATIKPEYYFVLKT